MRAVQMSTADRDESATVQVAAATARSVHARPAPAQTTQSAWNLKTKKVTAWRSATVMVIVGLATAVTTKPEQRPTAAKTKSDSDYAVSTSAPFVARVLCIMDTGGLYRLR